MFDISWSELLILGIVTLIFVGPKELPVFLRTIGRYVGMVKRQAGEFREQFDSAMREAELDQLRKDMMNVKSDVESTVRDAGRSVEDEFDAMRSELDSAAKGTDGKAARDDNLVFDPDAHDADGIPLNPPVAAEAATAPSKAQAAAEAARASAVAHNPPVAPPPAQTPEAMKSGV